MLRKMFFPILLGLAGCAVLISLGIWQVQRMHWKAGVLAEIEAMIHEAPVPLMAAPDPASDKFRPVAVDGQFSGEVIEVLFGIRRKPRCSGDRGFRDGRWSPDYGGSRFHRRGGAGIAA